MSKPLTVTLSWKEYQQLLKHENDAHELVEAETKNLKSEIKRLNEEIKKLKSSLKQKDGKKNQMKKKMEEELNYKYSGYKDVLLDVIDTLTKRDYMKNYLISKLVPTDQQRP